jgi:ABC-2 type transport system ATP-binding protein
VSHRTAETPSPGSSSAHNDVPALEVWDVVKQWAKGRPRVLDGLDLLVEPGRLVWIGGLNGAGKTTLLRVASGLIGPTEGEVRAYGLHPVHDRRIFQRRVGFLSAGNVGVYARLTVRGQLDCWARIAFVPRENRTQIIDDVMDAFALHPLAAQRSDRLSMGQRQRLRIAMTFIGDPDLVLLDEPKTSLDGEGGEMLVHAIKAVAARGGSVVWVSPTGEALPLEFDDHYLLEQGKLREL